MKTKKNSDFKIGEIVVYPKHGVGEITKIENMEIGSIKTNFYIVKMEQSKLTIRVPVDKKNEVGLPTTWGADRGAGAMGAGSLFSVCFIFFLIIKSTKKSKRETIKRIRAGSRRGALRADSARPTPPCVIKADWSWSVRESCHQCFSTGERVAFFTSRRWSPPPPRRARG